VSDRADELRLLDSYWRAANYLSVGQIYLLDNPLQREPLRIEHVKPRLLGHWGTTPGLNFVYAHMNRAIRAHDLEAIFVTGPGHGGPALVANTYLEGTYSEVYPGITRDAAGLRGDLVPDVAEVTEGIREELEALRRAARRAKG
jgi:xylulose-5-phosphate/fructose-6-phosphate phosphoketolase